jgi:TolB-like protein
VLAVCAGDTSTSKTGMTNMGQRKMGTNYTRHWLRPALLLLCTLFTLAGRGWASETLAILPFENNSLTDAERYNPLAKGFAAMLTTDMGRKVKTIKIVERSRIDSLLREMQLTMAGVVDEESAVQAGKILGARHIAFGSFTVLGEEVRLDVRVIGVESSAVVAAASVSGRSGEILGLITSLAAKIATSIQEGIIADTTGEEQGELDAAVSFSRGLEALDNGQTAEAKEWFTTCLAKDGSYRRQIEQLHSSTQ